MHCKAGSEFNFVTVPKHTLKGWKFTVMMNVNIYLKSAASCMTSLIRKHLFNVYFNMEEGQIFFKNNGIIRF